MLIAHTRPAKKKKLARPLSRAPLSFSIMALRRSLHTALRLLSSRAAGPSPHSAAAPLAARFSSAAAGDERAAPAAAAADAATESLDEVRARIFGTHIGDGRSTGRKLLRGALAGPAVATWYPPEIVDPLFLDVDDTR